MYLFYDKNNHLQEVINDVQLHEYDTSNSIYCFFENTSDSSYLSSISQVLLTLSKIDKSVSKVLQPATIVSSKIPYDAKRDLRYFKYYTDYTFYKFLLVDSEGSPVLLSNGYWFGNPTIYINGLATVLDALTFYIEENSIVSDSFVTESQYAYLLANSTVGTSWTVGTSIPSSGEYKIGDLFTLLPSGEVYKYNGTNFIDVGYSLKGDTGAKGDKGDTGAIVETSGMYGFNIQGGHLILTYSGTDAPPLSIDSLGHLIYSY